MTEPSSQSDELKTVLDEHMKRERLLTAERDAHAENEYRKLRAVGITDEQLPAVYEFARVVVEENTAAMLRRVGLRRDEHGTWYWPKTRRAVQ
ncbi:MULTISPECIES: hypothetical protein [unclassified Rhodococcus (in: high G+C Gram-positive bacteria)]|uniref:hypothetical protein n=1 Tax=unclassified Rhodococcus (in: high G+C Gram-positive bacteria) TaxID=192944 RepID=UPI0011400EA3|nr:MULTISPECIES: hypothetical protein [unclassified Rhodococcus (in: high G+C Gram-positive bacteria)]